MRSGGKRLKETEQYPAGFGRSIAIRHVFGKDRWGGQAINNILG